MWLRGFPLFLGYFQGDRLGQDGKLQLTDKVEDDFHRLPAVPGGLVCFMNNDLLDEFIHNGGGQLGDIHVLFHQSGETIVVIENETHHVGQRNKTEGRLCNRN